MNFNGMKVFYKSKNIQIYLEFIYEFQLFKSVTQDQKHSFIQQFLMKFHCLNVLHKVRNITLSFNEFQQLKSIIQYPQHSYIQHNLMDFSCLNVLHKIRNMALGFIEGHLYECVIQKQKHRFIQHVIMNFDCLNVLHKIRNMALFSRFKWISIVLMRYKKSKNIDLGFNEFQLFKCAIQDRKHSFIQQVLMNFDSINLILFDMKRS